jgi:hypothetical protein
MQPQPQQIDYNRSMAVSLHTVDTIGVGKNHDLAIASGAQLPSYITLEGHAVVYDPLLYPKGLPENAEDLVSIEDKHVGYKALREGIAFFLGRGDTEENKEFRDRFLFDPTKIEGRRDFVEEMSSRHQMQDQISSRHGSLKLTGESTLRVTNLNQSNGMSINKEAKVVQKDWNALIRLRGTAEDRYFYTSLERHNDPREEALIAGRHEISRDTPIDKGLYWARAGDTATVVDWDKHYKHGYEAVEQDLVERLTNAAPWPQGLDKKLSSIGSLEDRVRDPATVEHILSTIRQVVETRMPYNLVGTDRYESDVLDGIDGRSNTIKVSLTNYLARETQFKDPGGVCRQQCLLAGVLMEKAIEAGLLDGNVSVDRNAVKGVGGHAWARYTYADSNGKERVMIVDPAQRTSGEMSYDAVSESFSVNGEKCHISAGDGSTKWAYYRPSDVQKQLSEAQSNAGFWGRSNLPVPPQAENIAMAG